MRSVRSKDEVLRQSSRDRRCAQHVLDSGFIPKHHKHDTARCKDELVVGTVLIKGQHLCPDRGLHVMMGLWRVTLSPWKPYEDRCCNCLLFIDKETALEVDFPKTVSSGIDPCFLFSCCKVMLTLNISLSGRPGYRGSSGTAKATHTRHTVLEKNKTNKQKTTLLVSLSWFSLVVAVWTVP